MPKRNLHIVNPSNPLFAICERCQTRFTSFAYNTQEAEREVNAAFERHECHHGNVREKNGPAPDEHS